MSLADELKNQPVENNIQTLDIDIDTRKKFAVNGDLTRVIAIDTSDIGVIERLRDAMHKMNSLQQKFDKISKSATGLEERAKSVEYIEDDVPGFTQDVDTFSNDLAELESAMRELIDGIFDSPNLCDIILGKSSIFSPVNGRMKYEQIIDTLVKLYETNISAEVNKLNRDKIKTKTSKYIKK